MNHKQMNMLNCLSLSSEIMRNLNFLFYSFFIFQHFSAIRIYFYSQRRGCKIYNRLSLFLLYQEGLSHGIKFLSFSWDLCFLRGHIFKMFSLFLPVEPELKRVEVVCFVAFCFVCFVVLVYLIWIFFNGGEGFKSEENSTVPHPML